MSATELEELGADLRKHGSSNPPIDKAIKFLRVLRELKIRDPESVAIYGAAALASGRSQLSEEEFWLLHEQVAIAALSIGQVQYAAGLVRAVAKKFPDSMRTNRLKGMYWEAQGQLDQAAQIYKDMLEKQPSCEIAAKRLVAVDKSRGNLPAACDSLKKYLDVWPSDREAWEELGETYLELQQYRQALFCYEELLMVVPGYVQYLVRYADILYTLGGPSNLKLARSYYSKAVELSGGKSARALWGVTTCCANTAEKVALQDSLSRAVLELPGLAADALQQHYQEHAPSKLPALQRVLGGISSDDALL